MTAAPLRVADTGFKPFVARLHFYVGLFVGPFLLVAALTGTLYALTPQIESWLYRDQLATESRGPPRPLGEQAEAARAHLGEDLRFAAIRPATAAGLTTRVLFADPSLGSGRTRAVFVDPATLEIRGELASYGSSGILPFRTFLDELHRDLLLGEWGRLYSELAASWLWILALGGIALFVWRPATRRSANSPRPAGARLRRRHGVLGVALSAGFLFLSVTGLTWSQWAGGRIDALRDTLGWVTPAVRLTLDENGAAPVMAGEHAGHGTSEAHAMPAPVARDPMADLDAVAASARAAGIDSAAIEIRAPAENRAWAVREYDRSWPTQVDTVAVDPRTLAVTDRADFAGFPLVAKLVQWGIAAHMGVLFGVANQIVLAVLGLGLAATVVYGYRIWWRRRPAPGALPRTLTQSWARLAPALRLAAVLAALALGWALPVLGASLAAFVAVDVLRWHLARRRTGAAALAG